MANRNVPETGQAILVESIDYRDAEIQRGNIFQAVHTFTGIAAAGTAEILIVPGSSIVRLAVNTIKATVAASAQAFEGPTVGTDDEGTEIDDFNRDRESDETPETTIYHTPTTSADGTELPVHGLDPLAGFILDPSETYLIRITNDHDTDAGDFDYKVVWNEPD